MSIRPIDIKTTFVNTEDVGKIRDNQKTQEAGLQEQVAQNQNLQNSKTDTVQGTQASEGKTIRKEDEENGRGQSGGQRRKRKDTKEEEEKKPHIKDGIHGILDLKA